MNLQLVPFEELIRELLARHDHAVFIGVKTCKVQGIKSVRRYSGNRYTCSGMCQAMSMNVLDSMFQEEEKINKEDL